MVNKWVITFTIELVFISYVRCRFRLLDHEEFLPRVVGLFCEPQIPPASLMPVNTLFASVR